MPIAILALALALVLEAGPAGEPGPPELVKLLGSADRAEREEAARTLDELGAGALPALRAARAADDPGVRAGVAALLDRIEGRALAEPTRVALDFDGRPLGDVVRALGERSGFALALRPLGDTSLPARTIRATAPGPLPFWEALDRVGRAGHVRHNPGAREPRGSRDPVLALVDGEPPAPTWYEGPFRVHLFGLHRHSDLGFGGPRGSSSAQQTATVELQAFAEPGRFLDSDGLPRVEAFDDRGRPLPPPPSHGDWPSQEPVGHWITPGELSLLQWEIPLGLPDRPGTPLRLRGSLPVLVSARRPDPLVVPLADAAGKTFRHGASTLRFGAIPAESQGNLQFDLFVRQEAGASEAGDGLGLAPDPRAGRLPASPRHQIEVDDERGEPVPWFPSFTGQGEGGELHLRVFVSGARPARLRFYRLIRAAISIPFDFPDVPMP